MHYKFTPDEAARLLDLALPRASEATGLMDRGGKAEFIAWCRIIGELSTPKPLTIRDIPPALVSEVADVIEREGFRRTPVDSEEQQQREFARREGLDFDKEFGPIDPRARAPRCVHGKLFSEACPTCEGRCAHGLTLIEPCAACNRGVQPPIDQPGTAGPV